MAHLFIKDMCPHYYIHSDENSGETLLFKIRMVMLQNQKYLKRVHFDIDFFINHGRDNALFKVQDLN